MSDVPRLDAELARHAIQEMLAGKPPNGTAPAECGRYTDIVQGLFDGYEAGGSAQVRSIWGVMVKAQPDLARLVSEDSTPIKEEGSSSWGAILPFHRIELPPFPLDIFPTWLREFCEAVTESMQTPPDLAGMLALSILSTACAQRVVIRVWDGWDEPINVYTVTSLPPASRKSPVFRAMMAPVLKFEQNLTDTVEDQIMRAEVERDVLKQQLDEAKRKAAKAQGEHAVKMAFSDVDGINGELKDLVIPARPKLIVDDVTPERVAGILAEQGGRVAILSPEGDIFGIMAGRYSAGPPNIGVYLKAHNAEDVRVDRQNRTVFVKQAAITIGVTTQPEVMRAFGSNNAFRGQGLLARFFYALPRSTVGTRRSETTPIPDQVRTRYFHRVLTLLENVHSVHFVQGAGNSGHSGTDPDHHDSNNILYIKIFDTAQNLIRDFMDWIEPQLGEYGALHHLADWAGKLAGASIRVAGLLHMAETLGQNGQNGQITDDEVSRGIRLAHYLLAHAQAAYAEIGADPAVDAAKTILRWIEKAGAQAFNRRECYRGVRGPLFKSAEDCDAPLRLLADHGYIREVEQPERSGAGRKPSAHYEVNPVVLGQNGQNGQNQVQR